MFAEISTRLGGERMTFTFSWFERNCETIFMCNSSQTSVCVLFFVFFVVVSKIKDILWLFPRYVVFGWLVNLHCVQSSDLQTGASRPLLAPSSLHQIIA